MLLAAYDNFTNNWKTILQHKDTHHKKTRTRKIGKTKIK